MSGGWRGSFSKAAAPRRILPLLLARAKALDVSARRPQQFCIGADQTLLLDGMLFHKPDDLKAAAQSLARLAGRTHILLARRLRRARGRGSF